MADIKAVTYMSENRWLIEYNIWAACGCYQDRKSIWVTQKEEPTKEQILKLIDESSN